MYANVTVFRWRSEEVKMIGGSGMRNGMHSEKMHSKQTECGMEYSNKSEFGMEYIPEIFGMYKLCMYIVYKMRTCHLFDDQMLF